MSPIVNFTEYEGFRPYIDPVPPPDLYRFLSAAEIDVAQCHLDVIDRIAQNKDENALILEEDIEIPFNLKERWGAIFAQAEGSEVRWELIQICGPTISDPNHLILNRRSNPALSATCGYVIKRQLAETIRSYSDDLHVPILYELINHIWEFSTPVYWATPSLLTQTSGGKTISATKPHWQPQTSVKSLLSRRTYPEKLKEWEGRSGAILHDPELQNLVTMSSFGRYEVSCRPYPFPFLFFF